MATSWTRRWEAVCRLHGHSVAWHSGDGPKYWRQFVAQHSEAACRPTLELRTAAFGEQLERQAEGDEVLRALGV